MFNFIKKINGYYQLAINGSVDTANTSSLQVYDDYGDNIFQRNIITIKQTGRPVINMPSSYGITKIPFNSYLNCGNKLTFVNNSIIIGKGIKKIKISGQVVLWTAPSSNIIQMDVAIQKNGANINACIEGRLTESFNTFSLTAALEEVVEGDAISMAFGSSTAGNYTVLGDSTRTLLTVEVVE